MRLWHRAQNMLVDMDAEERAAWMAKLETTRKAKYEQVKDRSFGKGSSEEDCQTAQLVWAHYLRVGQTGEEQGEDVQAYLQAWAQPVRHQHVLSTVDIKETGEEAEDGQ